jgi:restriction endonuclease S subunit
VPLPPLEIQQEIVTEIEGYQKVIDGCRQVVDNWKPRIEVDPEWPMVKLGDVCELNPKKSEVSSIARENIVSFLPMEDIGIIQDIHPQKERSISEVYNGYSYFRDNDVLIAKVTPCFENGKSGIARKLKQGIGFGSTELHVIRPSNKILPEYIYPYISSRNFLMIGKTKMTGTGGLQRLPVQFVLDFEIPFPPLEIQQEIVAKIEAEQKVIDGCRELMVKYEEKIKNVVDGVWGE